MDMSRIDEQIRDEKQEHKDLLAYPRQKLGAIIKEVGFGCDMCARCCTKAFNDHVFLLDRDIDTIREIDPDAIEPAPYYEFCDQKGTFYVSGYSLRTNDKGECVFLKDRRCTIYKDRPAICSLYPYMLHRQYDENNVLEWRQISGLNEHGCYHNEITDEEAEKIAEQTIAYEKEYLEKQIRFMEKVREHFNKNKLRHVQATYDRQVRLMKKGKDFEVYVFSKGELELTRTPIEK